MQSFLLLWAIFCSVSRITDHRHHWWDVLTGGLFGALVAWLTVNYLKFLAQEQFSNATVFLLLFRLNSYAIDSSANEPPKLFIKMVMLIATLAYEDCSLNEPRTRSLWIMLLCHRKPTAKHIIHLRKIFLECWFLVAHWSNSGSKLQFAKKNMNRTCTSQCL